MKTLLKLLLLLVVVVAVAGAGGVGYLYSKYPSVPPAETVTIERTPERLARGEYLVKHVVVCLECHSERDMTKYSGPVKPGTEGMGGENLGDATLAVFAKNITPAAIGNWSDGEVIRAMTSGVTPKGEALFPMMPYPHFASLDRADVEAAVAYIRTLKPITHDVPARKLPFPLPLVVRTMPAASHPQTRPDPKDKWRYGKYLVNAAVCSDCHSPQDSQGQVIPGKEFAGGMEFPLPGGGVVRSANITPEANTGIGSWTEEQFIQKFKGFAATPPRDLTKAEQRENSMMPWTAYAGMTEEDLKAIYNYLRYVKPVRNTVVKFN